MRAFANLNDGTLKLVCGKKKKKVPTRSFVLSSLPFLSLPPRAAALAYTRTRLLSALDPCLNVRYAILLVF